MDTVHWQCLNDPQISTKRKQQNSCISCFDFLRYIDKIMVQQCCHQQRLSVAACQRNVFIHTILTIWLYNKKLSQRHWIAFFIYYKCLSHLSASCQCQLPVPMSSIVDKTPWLLRTTATFGTVEIMKRFWQFQGLINIKSLKTS